MNLCIHKVWNMYLLWEALPVHLTAQRPEPCCCLLRRNIPLGFGHQLVPNEELAHRRGTKQGWVEVHVEVAVLGLFFRTFERCLVDTGAYSPVSVLCFSEFLLFPVSRRLSTPLRQRGPSLDLL